MPSTVQRCLRLSAGEAGLGSEMRAQLAMDWFVLEGERFGLPADSVWLLPREQRATTSGVQRTHGGASLDETLVPVASFVPRSPSAPTLVVTLDGRLVAGSPSPAMLTIANLSTRVLHAVRVRISALGAGMEVERIEPEDLVARPVTVLANRSGQVEVTATGSALGADVLTAAIADTRGAEPDRVALGRIERDRDLALERYRRTRDAGELERAMERLDTEADLARTDDVVEPLPAEEAVAYLGSCLGYGSTPRARDVPSPSRCSSRSRCSACARCGSIRHAQPSIAGSPMRFRHDQVVMVGARGIAPSCLTN